MDHFTDFGRKPVKFLEMSFYPQVSLSVIVNCTVGSFKDSLTYQYFWTNQLNSRQRMENFALAGVKKNFVTFQPVNWRFIGWWQDKPIAGWEVTFKSTQFEPCTWQKPKWYCNTCSGIAWHCEVLYPGLSSSC